MMFKTALFFFLFSLSAFSGIRSDLMPALTKLLEMGPDRWVRLPTHPTGKYLYQRGLSDGPLEALMLLSGERDHSLRHVSFVGAPQFSDLLVSSINSSYSKPLTVRGRTEHFEKMSWAENLDQFDSSTLLKHHIGSTQNIPKGHHIDGIESIGTFFPMKNRSDSSVPELSLDSTHLVEWGYFYVILYQELMQSGIKPAQDSRGYHFYKELKTLLETYIGKIQFREEPDSMFYAKVYMRIMNKLSQGNAKILEQAVRKLFEKYQSCLGENIKLHIAPQELQFTINSYQSYSQKNICCVSIWGQRYYRCENSQKLEKELAQRNFFSDDYMRQYNRCKEIHPEANSENVYVRGDKCTSAWHSISLEAY